MRALVCLLLIVFVSCSNKDSVPDGILPPDKMESVLWDVIRADVMVTYTSVRDTTLNKLEKNTELYQQIFQIHHISKDQFKRSLHYYRSHPLIMQTVFDSLYSQASKRGDTLMPQ